MNTPPDLVASAESVKEIAGLLGFDDCRIAAVTGPAPHGEAFRQWVNAAEYGDMTWMAKAPARRMDPREVLPDVRSVVTVALNYYRRTPVERAEEDGARGRIARYAWGDDYHDVMDSKFRDLAAALEEMGGKQRFYVDTGPVLERDWASAAGLGWNGKSTVQIHPKLGTWTFLGEILTTLPLAPDPPSRDHCGTCTRCITACPTAAITAPHHVDARRCISYLTIEHKGSIPEEFRRAIGDRIYGCDECLDVCPWNRFAKESREAAFAARSFVAGWTLREFLSLTDAGFRELFRWSPIKRIKRAAFLRNVCIALGNTGDASDLPALEAAAQKEEPLVSEHARWAVAEIQQRQSSPSSKLDSSPPNSVHV
ncbi:MAG TPA: tRNA epoxyqueuosine(34) reductase QueG [Verrucomicrobiales bacterium]|nr:tRNA epoxyqueuosine(34) reductase QueG [Verrucomicrobiales bacterium]